MYRQWGGTVIGMTACPEYKLAREAEMAYCTIAMVRRDFDFAVLCKRYYRIFFNNLTIALR